MRVKHASKYIEIFSERILLMATPASTTQIATTFLTILSEVNDAQRILNEELVAEIKSIIIEETDGRLSLAEREHICTRIFATCSIGSDGLSNMITDCGHIVCRELQAVDNRNMLKAKTANCCSLSAKTQFTTNQSGTANQSMFVGAKEVYPKRIGRKLEGVNPRKGNLSKGERCDLADEMYNIAEDEH